MTHEDIAKRLAGIQEQIVLIYAFNGTGKTRLSVAYKDLTKNADGIHAGIYYNAYSEDLFIWDNDSDNSEVDIKLDIRRSSLNRFHSSLTKDDIREKLERYRPNYQFEFIYHKNPEDGIESIRFFDEIADPMELSNIDKIARKISRGEERIFVWCFFLALFEIEGWADKQSSHFFINDPVSSLDDHNIFITASTLFDFIEEHYKARKLFITTHHLGFFSILSDWLKKGEKASMFKNKAIACILSLKEGGVTLENCRNDVLLYHLRLLQVLDKAQAAGEAKAYHFALLRQVLENIASFLGVGQFSYVLKQIRIDDTDDQADNVNFLSHKKVYYFESDTLGPTVQLRFDKIFNGLKEKYQFVLHTPGPITDAKASATSVTLADKAVQNTATSEIKS